MSSARMAPMWRSSSSRCLALRPRPIRAPARLMATAARPAPRPAARPAPRPAAQPAPRPAALSVSTQATMAAPYRGYADDATTRSTASSTDSTAAAAPQPPSAPAPQASAQGPEPQHEAAGPTTPENEEALRQLERLAQGLAPFDAATDGHKFGLTTATTRAATAGAAGSGLGADDADGAADPKALALPQARKLQDRYDPVTQQLTRLLMRDGKLAKAQRDMAMILNYLRTSPPPKLNPARPLLPGHPPAAQLPLDPVAYLALAMDSVAPLIKIKSLSGLAGGGRALPVPMPLAARQRRRTAFIWLLELVNKRPSRGSGRSMFAHRVAEEVVAVVEGRSTLWDKRQLLHKQGTTARVNVVALQKRKRF